MAGERRTLEITGLGAQGDGIAETADGLLHIPRALPGETVTLEADGRTTLHGPPSPDRRSTPPCRHFPACGGCALQHMTDEAYRTWKGALLAETLAQKGMSPEIGPTWFAPTASRRRATLTGRWQEGRFVLGFHGLRSHALEPIAGCVVLTAPIVAALEPLARLAGAFAAKEGDTRVGVLDTGQGLDVAVWRGTRAAAPKISPETAALARAANALRLTVDGQPVQQLAAPVIDMDGIAVTPPPGAFLQAVQEAEDVMAAVALEGLGKARKVADLFCGLGTFALRIARTARVAAVDGDQALLSALGQATRHAKGLKPVETLKRDLFRDPLSPLELNRFDAVLLDPPRAGAKAQAAALARSKVGTVVMVSCNPATLARDLQILIDGGYAIERALAVDQFLYTAHLEAIAVLKR